MTHANDADLVRVGAWMLGSAAVLMAGAFIAEPIRFFALASYMLAAPGLMVLRGRLPRHHGFVTGPGCAGSGRA